MKTYKHKTNGTILTKCKNGNSYYSEQWEGYYIPSEFVEDSCDWEEVVEKSYEIISFGNQDNNLLYTLHNDRYRIQSIDGFSVIGDRDLHYCLRYYKIISIKRLSDGEIFAIGDKTTKGTIEKIMLNNSKSVFGISTDLHKCWNGSATFEKLKSPLFTTYDGVDIFTGGGYWWTDKEVKSDTNSYYNEAWGGDNIHQTRITFAKKENAEKYIKENKKIYSLNDIKETVKKLGCFGTTLIEYLEKNDK